MSADETATSTCTEQDCTAAVADAPGSRCGECGELFCDNHLWVTERDGYLCATDAEGLAR